MKSHCMEFPKKNVTLNKKIKESCPSQNYQTRTCDLRKLKIRLTSSVGSVAYVGPSVWKKSRNEIKKLTRFFFGRLLAELLLS